MYYSNCIQVGYEYYSNCIQVVSSGSHLFFVTPSGMHTVIIIPHLLYIACVAYLYNKTRDSAMYISTNNQSVSLF